MNDLARDSIPVMLSTDDLDWEEAKESQAILEAMAQIFSGATRFSGEWMESAARPTDPIAYSPRGSTAVGLVTIDGERVIRSFSEGARAIFGYEPGEIVGQRLDLILP